MRDYKAEAEMNAVNSNRIAYRESGSDYLDMVRSWSETFLHELSKEWIAYMESVTTKSKESIESNDMLIEEQKAKAEFIKRKMEEEAKEERDLFLVKKQKEDQYRKSIIPPQLFKTEIQYQELVDNIAELSQKPDTDPEILKKMNEDKNSLEKKHEEYMFKFDQREVAKKELTEAEENYKQYKKQYDRSVYTQTNLNVALQRLSVYEKIKEINHKVVFDDAEKLKNEFYRGLNSENSITQLTKKVVSSLNIAAQGNLFGGEFSQSDLILYVSYFIREMDKYNLKDFNFVKQAILKYNEDTSKDNIIVIKFDDIPFQRFLSNIINNISRQLIGASYKALSRTTSERDNTFSLNETVDDGEGGKTKKLDMLNEDQVSPSGERITDNNVIDPTSKKFFKEIKDHLNESSVKERIFKMILDLFEKKLPPRALFHKPSDTLKRQLKNSLGKMFDSIGEELMRDNYVHPRLKNIIIDSVGGTEETIILNKEVSIIVGAIKYEFIKYMIDRIEKSIKNNDGFSSKKTDQLLDALKLTNKKTYNKLQSESRVAKNQETVDGFIKPDEMAKKLVESSFQVENKVDFLLNDKKEVDKDQAKYNQSIQVTPLRTQHDYGYSACDEGE